MKKIIFILLFLTFSLSSPLIRADLKIPARDVIATDKNNNQRNLQNILDQIVPTNPDVDLSALTATASELNALDGISANVTASNLNTLTGGGQTALHSHASGSSTTTLDQAYDNDTTGDAQITVDARDVSFDLNDATNDYKVSIDNTTAGQIADALELTTSGVGGTFVDGIDASDGGITNAINVGANTVTGTTAVIDFTDFDVSADGTVILATDTAGATAMLDLNHAATSGTQTDGIIIQVAGAILTDAIDVSDSDITNALNLGANRITGTNIEWDGVGQLVIGTGGGGGDGVGTGILTFKGGGTIDSTNDGSIIIAPQDAGIVDFPSGTTVRLPPASPAENKNGIYYDGANNKICVDDDGATDVCTAALSLSSLSLSNEQQVSLNRFLENVEGVEKLRVFISNPGNFEKLAMLADMTLEERERMRMSEGNRNVEFSPMTGPSSQPFVFDRGSAKLLNGQIYIELDPIFCELIEMDAATPSYKVQLTPTSADVRGPLVAEKSDRGFKVIDVGGETSATFDWEVAAIRKQ